VFAAAPGTVVGSFDGLPDQASPGPPPIPPIGDTVGNHVIVKIKPGIFLLYAHMKPGSVLVKKGQTLKQGQRIGSVGTSGNSSTPHLHFQVLTERTFFPADSAPFRFAKFDLVGHLVVTPGVERIWDDNMGSQPDGVLPYEAATDPGPRRRVMPLDRDIITFAK
jgi:murein DD-endopeptidase MepM/ murein hydrolase activator NlpD